MKITETKLRGLIRQVLNENSSVTPITMLPEIREIVDNLAGAIIEASEQNVDYFDADVMLPELINTLNDCINSFVEANFTQGEIEF